MKRIGILSLVFILALIGGLAFGTSASPPVMQGIEQLAVAPAVVATEEAMTLDLLMVQAFDIPHGRIGTAPITLQATTFSYAYTVPGPGFDLRL